MSKNIKPSEIAFRAGALKARSEAIRQETTPPAKPAHTLSDQDRAFLKKVIARDTIPGGLPILREPPGPLVEALERAGYIRLGNAMLMGRPTGERCVLVTDAGRRVLDLLDAAERAHASVSINAPNLLMTEGLKDLLAAIAKATGGAA